MHFREKIAWLTVSSMVIAYSIYFGLIVAGHPASRETFPMLWLFGTIASFQALFVIAVSIFFAVSTPKEARQPADERDRAIAHRGANTAYYVLISGLMLVGVVMAFNYNGVELFNSALLILVLAEGIRHAVILSSYRKGWHG